QIDIEDGEIEFRLLGQRNCLVEAAGLRCDTVTKIRQHAFEQHTDHQLIFDNENALAGSDRPVTHLRLPPCLRPNASDRPWFHYRQTLIRSPRRRSSSGGTVPARV